jgi:cell surface protein SprA
MKMNKIVLFLITLFAYPGLNAQKSTGKEKQAAFYLAQYFQHNRDALNKNSGIKITRLELWVTNRSGTTKLAHEVVALTDLAEPNPYNHNNAAATGKKQLPANSANNLYAKLIASPFYRSISLIVSALTGPNFNFKQGPDFEMSYACKLDSTQFTLNPTLGYVSLNIRLNPDDIIAVAYEYTYKGKNYHVGEFVDQLTEPDSEQKVLFLKLLKGISAHPELPISDLVK